MRYPRRSPCLLTAPCSTSDTTRYKVVGFCTSCNLPNAANRPSRKASNSASPACAVGSPNTGLALSRSNAVVTSIKTAGKLIVHTNINALSRIDSSASVFGTIVASPTRSHASRYNSGTYDSRSHISLTVGLGISPRFSALF